MTLFVHEIMWDCIQRGLTVFTVLCAAETYIHMATLCMSSKEGPPEEKSLLYKSKSHTPLHMT